MKKIACMLLLIQGGFMMAQTKTVVTQFGEKVIINPYANNGLTAADGFTQLGGSLLKPTTLVTTSAFTLAIQGLETGATADKILVVDANGVLKWIDRSTLGGDNLGNHTATTNLDMSDKHINNVNNANIKLANISYGVSIKDRTATNTNDFILYKSNGTLGVYNSIKGSNALSVLEANSNVGIGTATPANALHVKATADPLKLEGLLDVNSSSTNYNLVVDGNGVVKKTAIESLPEVGSVVQLAVSAGFDTESDAFLSADLGSSIKQLIFKGKRYDPKNAYNNSTGVFTATESGYYKFECVVLMYNNSGAAFAGIARVGLSKPNQLMFSNGNASFSSLNQPYVSSAGSNEPVVIPYSGMQYMDKGQQCIFGTRFFGNWNLQVSRINYDVKTASYMAITYMGK